MNKYSTNRIVDFQGNGFQLPLDLLKQSLDIKQKKFDVNYEMSKKLQDIAVPALPQDIPLVRAKQLDYQRKVMDLVKQSGGDYSLLGKQFLDLAYDVKRDMSPTGELGQVAGYYNHYKTWVDYHQQKADKVNKSVVNGYIKKKMDAYKGVAAGDVLRLENIPDHIVVNERLDKQLKEVPIDEFGDSRVLGKDKYGRIVSEDTKTKSRAFEKLHAIGKQALLNDPQIRAQYELYGDILGIDPNKALEIDAAIGAAKFTVSAEDNTIHTKKYDDDQYGLADYKAKLKYKYDKQLMDQSNQRQLLGEINLGIEAPKDQNSVYNWLVGGAANLYGLAGQASGFGNFQQQKDQAYNYLADGKYGKFDTNENAIATVQNHIKTYAHGDADNENIMGGFRDYVAKNTGKRLEEVHSPNIQKLYKDYFDKNLSTTVNRRSIYGIPFTDKDAEFVERAANNTPSLMYRDLKTGETKSGYDLGLSDPLGDDRKKYTIRSTGFGTDYGTGIMTVGGNMYEMINDSHDPVAIQYRNATIPLRGTNAQTYGTIKYGPNPQDVAVTSVNNVTGQLEAFKNGHERFDQFPSILETLRKESIKNNFKGYGNSWKFSGKGEQIDE